MGPHAREGGPILLHTMARRLLRGLCRGRLGPRCLTPQKPCAGLPVAAGMAGGIWAVAPRRAHFRGGRCDRPDLAYTLRYRSRR